MKIFQNSGLLDLRNHHGIIVAISICWIFFNISILNSQSDTIPDLRNISYGPDDKHKFDVFFSEKRNGPCVVYFHGGAFRSGDKDLDGRQIQNMLEFKKKGIHFISANYRLSKTTRLDSILMDAERLIRFLKMNSTSLQIDASKIGIYGSSAGGCLALWVGLNPSEADPFSSDSLLHYSTQVKAVAHVSSQSTLDMAQWSSILAIDSNWMEIYDFKDDLAFYKINTRTQYNTPEIKELRKKLDTPMYIDETDCPVMYCNASENISPNELGAITHHPRHAIYLDSISKLRNHKHFLNLEKNGNLNYQIMIDFLCDQLNSISSTVKADTDYSTDLVSYSNFNVPQFNVNCPDSDCTIKLMNLNGQIIFSAQKISSGRHEFSELFSILPAGMNSFFFVEIQSAGKSQSIKVFY